jgi:choline dehydrogenase-like flavoprotein
MRSRNSNYIVVGSGPSGTSASLALLKGGGNVTMLDIGNNLPQDTTKLVESIAKIDPSQWTNSDIAILRNSFTLTKKDIPKKTLFGSRFPYQDSSFVLGPDGLPSGFHQFPSSSFGGFSRLWGAAIMRLHPADVVSWPVKNLETYYKIVESLLPISGNNDGLSSWFNFPLHATSAKISGQALKFLKL